MRWMLPLTLLWSVGCTPPCQQVCRKILECDTLESQRVAVEECELSCEVQAALYADWEDEAKEDAFDDHKRCLMQESCDDIADGVCYDEDLFLF